MSLESYQELKVWQLGMTIAEQCYFLTKNYPKDELFGLTSQIRRASARIPANIAEGYGRGHRAEYRQFLRISNGSLKELETHLLLSARVETTSPEVVAPILGLCEEERKMLIALIRSLES